ncbi:MAG TPA: aldehyde dehydrogenase family protein [Rhodocyclaceae bacterium]|nr:aldehyde dehydrogenase family protein [Rhodocyclaceae bacterium]
MSAVLKLSSYINGEWTVGGSTSYSDNPSDLDNPVAEVSRANAAQTDIAIDAAAAAFPSWSVSGIQRRADILDQVGSEIVARREELGILLAREEGKSLPEAIGEATRAGHIFKFFAGEVLRIAGERMASVRPGIDVEITREPIGVVGIIAPWNFPLAIPAWKIAPALAYGNTVVFKPAEAVPACAWQIADMLHRAGLPAGVFNLVIGSGREVGARILENPKVDAVSFTGSVATGEHVLLTTTRRRAKVQLEMGGKNPLLVLDDADIDVAINAAINGAFFSTGQRCTASSRIIVTAGIHDRFVDAMRTRTTKLAVGAALEKTTEIGPVVDAAQLKQDLDYIGIGRSEGAELLEGGEQVERSTRGHFLTPALFLGSPEMRISREEVFGPVAVVIKADNYEHGLALANDTPFGLCAGICTTSLKQATHFKRHAQAGMLMVNLPTAGVDYHVPFGGSKGSSYGPREQGRYAAEFYTKVKTAYISA